MKGKHRVIRKSEVGKRFKGHFGQSEVLGTPEEVLDSESQALLQRLQDTEDSDANPEALTSPLPLLPPQTEIELDIEELSSTGDGLAYFPDKSTRGVYVVPFAVPGDKVLAKAYLNRAPPSHRRWVRLDFVKTLSSSPLREGTEPKCPYFGTCAGCQLQMLPYATQLAHKKTIVEKAFKHFSNLDPSMVPPVDNVIGSPAQYGYRTKLTPHYDGKGSTIPWHEGAAPPPFGFSRSNNARAVLDIEQCPIATDILNKGLALERKKLQDYFWKKSTGSTVLLRETTTRELNTDNKDRDLGDSQQELNDANDSKGPNVSPLPLEDSGPPLTTVLRGSPSNPQITYTYPRFTDTKMYTTDTRSITKEHIGPYMYANRAASFFQNNNIVLPVFLAYIRQNIFPGDQTTVGRSIKYLIDAYCGSGLFSVALASDFSSTLGVDVDAQSIECARENAWFNKASIQASAEASGRKTTTPTLGFMAAEAEAIFEDVPYPPEQTLCVMDPPRKGASVDFLKQLSLFGPKKVVYVSCNVHTQARDVGMLVQGFDELRNSGKPSWRYKITKLGGFDFFPQTGHVEGVCFLERVENEPSA
jgi:tRNA (uracil-5-)-methyltransferase